MVKILETEHLIRLSGDQPEIKLFVPNVEFANEA